MNEIVMCSEPAPDLTIEQAERMISEIKNESELAELFAVIHNKAWWVEDDIYDFEEGTKEYKQVAERADSWFALADKLQNMIFDILKKEGVEIPKTGQIEVIRPFMERNGFKDGQGWFFND